MYIPTLKTLGFIFDSTLKLDKQTQLFVAVFFQLSNISKLRTSLSYKDLEAWIHAFISSRLDY